MEESFSQSALLAALRDIRLPDAGAGGLTAELLVCAGLAALASALVIGLVRGLFRGRVTSAPPDLPAQIATAQALPPARRRVALLHLLRQHAPARHAALSGMLYAPDGIALPALEAEVQRLV